jgi:nitroreductase
VFEKNTSSTFGIETFQWRDDGSLLIKTYYDMPESVGAKDDPLPDDVLHRILDNPRFAPSGSNRQGGHVLILRSKTTREAQAELTLWGAKRYLAQILAGESPWNTVTPTKVGAQAIAQTEVSESFTEPLLKAAVVLVVCVDLRVVASTDSELDRVGIISGASVYPLAWNILLAARTLAGEALRVLQPGSVTSDVQQELIQ